MHADIIKKQSAAISQEKQQLQKQLLQYKEQLTIKEKEFEEIRIKASSLSTQVQHPEVNVPVLTDNTNVSKSSFIAVLFLAVIFAAFSAYSYFKNNRSSKPVVYATKVKTKPNNDYKAVTNKTTPNKKIAVNKKALTDTDSGRKFKKTTEKLPQPAASDKKEIVNKNPGEENAEKTALQYTVVSKAYFYNTPDETTRRNAYITHWNNAVLTPSDDINGFIYIVYTNDKGQTSRGWLRKADLKPLQ